MSGRDIIGSRNCPVHGRYQIAGTEDDSDHRDCEPRPEPAADVADAARRDAAYEGWVKEALRSGLSYAPATIWNAAWAAGRHDAFEQAKACGWEGCTDDGHEH